MKIDVDRHGSPLDLTGDRRPNGLEEMVIDGLMEYDGEGYFLNFEAPSLRQLSSICFWLEGSRPGLRVSKLVPKHISKEESLKIRGSMTEDASPNDHEWTIKIGPNGTSFLMSMQLEWRT